MRKPVVYTAGPIAGCSWDATVDWREYVQKMLEQWCDVRSPMRGKEFLKARAAMPLTAEEVSPVSSQHAIVIRDYNDVQQADALIVNLLPSADISKASIGTAFELAWCYAAHTPAVVVMNEDNPNWHPFVLEAAYVVVPTLLEGVDIVRQVLNLEV